MVHSHYHSTWKVEVEGSKFKASRSYISKLDCMKPCIKGGKRVLNKVYSDDERVKNHWIREFGICMNSAILQHPVGEDLKKISLFCNEDIKTHICYSIKWKAETGAQDHSQLHRWVWGQPELHKFLFKTLWKELSKNISKSSQVNNKRSMYSIFCTFNDKAKQELFQIQDDQK